MTYIDNYGNLVTCGDSNGLELRHFGILGMHWGIRRFQPYPKGHTGDGKFVGEKSTSGKSATTGNANRFETNVKPATGIKEIDDAISLVKKNGIHAKPAYGKVTGDAKTSADIGVKAVDAIRGPGYIDKNYDNTEWFIFEDQTIGMYEVADLARQGKSKEEIKSIIKNASKVFETIEDLSDEDYSKYTKLLDKHAGKGATDSIFSLGEFNNYELREDGYGKGDAFIEECIKEAEKRKNIKHNASMTIDNFGYMVPADELYHHGVLGQRWGRKNGPPYPLDARSHSAAEKKAGWRKSLGNIAKATGKGVARGVRGTARGVAKTVVGTARGVKAVAKGTKKALIRVNLYPKKLMSADDIAERVERLRQEDELKRAMGKLTNADKLNQKLKQKDMMRDVAKQTLSQLLPAIGRDVIIRKIQDHFEVSKREKLADIEYETEMAKRDDLAARENAKKVWNDIYEDARAARKSASEAQKLADKGKGKNVEALLPRAKDNKDNKGGKGQFDADNAAAKDIYETAKANGYTASQAAEMAKNKDDSLLKGLFGKSSDSGKKAKADDSQKTSNNEKNTESQAPKAKAAKNSIDDQVEKDLYDRWSKIYDPVTAQKLAKGRVTSYLPGNSKYDEDWDAAIKENKKRDTAAKAKATKQWNETMNPTIKAEADKRGVDYSSKSSLEKIRDRVKAEQERTEKAIRERGGTVVGLVNGQIIYKDDQDITRRNSFVDRVMDRIELEERKKG